MTGTQGSTMNTGYQKAKAAMQEYNRWQREESEKRCAGKVCERCGSPISYAKRMNRYCSHSCAAKTSNVSRATQPKSCLVCGKDIPACSLAVTCSRECGIQHRRTKYIDDWLAGLISGSKKNGKFSSAVKRWLMETSGSACSKCGWSEVNTYSNTIPLEVHHLDGDSSNNRPENLQLLCPNCHSLTSTHGGLNACRERA
jgi:hypothetical protein